MAGSVIKRRQLLGIATGVIKGVLQNQKYEWQC